MKIKTVVVLSVFAVSAAWFAAGYRNSGDRPSDLRDAVSDSSFEELKTEVGAEGSEVSVPKPAIKPFYVETGSRIKAVNKGYVVDDVPPEAVPPVEFITIPGGKFTMGTNSGGEKFKDARPIHVVTVKTFTMSKTAVTVGQYKECMLKGGCTEPGTGGYCNWGVPGRWLHPVNCVDWYQAKQYAKFKGARLPSEAEWEYAATSGGRNQKYPWGNDAPDCNRAVMYGDDGNGCGKNSTWPVCSKPAGNTAQGLCDMAGNVGQWMQDKYQDSYVGAPVDGSAFDDANGYGYDQVVRGASFYGLGDWHLRADHRKSEYPGRRDFNYGFRLARSSR